MEQYDSITCLWIRHKKESIKWETVDLSENSNRIKI